MKTKLNADRLAKAVTSIRKGQKLVRKLFDMEADALEARVRENFEDEAFAEAISAMEAGQQALISIRDLNAVQSYEASLYQMSLLHEALSGYEAAGDTLKRRDSKKGEQA